MKKNSINGASWDSMFLAFGKVLTMLFSIISAKMMAEGLSLTEYGTYSQTNLVNNVAASFLLLGLGDALNYYYNGKQKDIGSKLRDQIVNTIFFIEILFGMVWIACVIFGQNLLVDYFDNPAVRGLLPIAAVLPMMSNIIYFYQVLYVSVGKAKLVSVYGLIMTVVRVITIYFAVYVLKNLLLIYVVMVLQDLVQILLYNITLVRKNVRINPLKISPKYVKPIFAYGLPMGIYAITSTLTRELGKLVVDRMASTEELAIYTNCSKLLPVDIIVNSFALVLVPYIIRFVTEKDQEKCISLFANYQRVGYYSVWILGTMLLISPTTMISFLYDDKYLPGAAIFVLYIFDSMLRFASMHQVLVASNKTKHLMFYSIGSLGLNFVLNIIFYYMFGLIGPAIATLISAIIYTWIILHKSMKLINAKWNDIFDVKEMVWLLITLGGLWSICFMLCKGLSLLGLHPYLSMIMGMAVFGCSALAIHFKKISGVLKQINAFRIH